MNDPLSTKQGISILKIMMLSDSMMEEESNVKCSRKRCDTAAIIEISSTLEFSWRHQESWYYFQKGCRVHMETEGEQRGCAPLNYRLATTRKNHFSDWSWER
ncbi:hypothetical protein CEXT_617891 [Caerostris extrusa]|uniref:Ycf15 n=1 Tax=Caerostris extrusa TaxID=172846 RepID=A0AAV4PIX5_CAEEX|nr:hypothetical protein CEXT_617891 [Caerostris extrusa]